MTPEKQEALEAKGFQVGSAEAFLGSVSNMQRELDEPRGGREMTDAELDAIEAKCARTTGGLWAGAWSTDAYYQLHACHPTHTETLAELCYPTKWDGEKQVTDPGRKREVVWNLAFMASAKEDVRALVAEVRSLRAQIDQMTENAIAYFAAKNDPSQ